MTPRHRAKLIDHDPHPWRAMDSPLNFQVQTIASLNHLSPMAMPSQDDSYLSNGQITSILVAMGSAAFLVLIYYLVGICLCNQSITNRNPEQGQRHQYLVTITPSETPSQPSVAASLIPSHKYKKKKEVASDDTCAVCLGEFEEGDELRTLPECMHSYHVPCIDKWFYLHSSCPVCRKLAMPSPAIHSRVSDFGSGDVNRHHNSGTLQTVVAHNRVE